MNKKWRTAIYIRVSTEEQYLNGLSLPAQKQALTNYAIANGYEIAGYYADEGISARKPMKARKELQRLLQDVQEDKIDRILVTKLDRWFRNIKDYQITQEILEAHNCCWKTIFENYDSSTANGQMIINIMLSVNQAECDRTSERIKAVFDYKRANGELISSRMVPYGYIAVDGHPQKDPETRQIVEDAYTHYFSAYSVQSVIRFLQSKYGSKAPSDSIIDRFFKNEKYAGRNKTDLSFCEPYITYDQFLLIQKTKSRRTYTSCKNTHYIFSSLIQCPVCLGNYTGFQKKYPLKNGGFSICIRYRCANKYNRHPGAVPSESRIEKFMISQLLPALTEKFPLALKRKARIQNTETEASVLAELERLNTLYLKGRITGKFYESRYDALCETLASCRALSESPHKSTNQQPEIKTSILHPDSFFSIYQTLDARHRSIFWKSCIEKIYIDAQTRQIAGFRFL